MIRAVFLDLDGTLVGAENRVSPAVCGAVRRVREVGCEVVICTGRSRISTEPVADQLGFRGYAVMSNGAVVMHLRTREVLCRNRMPVASAVQAVRALMSAGAAPQVYEDAVESARILYHPEHPVRIYDPERYLEWPHLDETLPFAPVCVSSYGAEEVLRPIADRLAQDPIPETFVEQAGTHEVWCVEIHHEQSGKCNGLQRVADRLGVRREEVLAIGDHINDLKMLQFAGIGVAMGNALPEIQAAADFVTGSLAEDGVAMALERFVLGG